MEDRGKEREMGNGRRKGEERGEDKKEVENL